MNYEQITGILKIAVPVILAILAPIGFSSFSDPATVSAITAGTVAVGAGIWSYFSHTNAAKIASVAAIDPGMKVLVPHAVIAEDPKVASLVADTSVPNVTKLPSGPPGFDPPAKKEFV
jgi:hypothetical protein